MSLRAALSGKAPRRVIVPVQVQDPAPARAALAAAEAIAATHTGPKSPSTELALATAREALDACFVSVGFTALASAEYERLLAAHRLKDGEADWEALLPLVAAACADDDELRDAEWWREQLDSAAWGAGEKAQLRHRLASELNFGIPAASLGKG